MLDLIPDVWGWIVGALGAVVGMGALWFGGKRSAKKDQEIDNLEARVRREEIEDEIDDMGVDARRDELAKWVSKSE